MVGGQGFGFRCQGSGISGQWPVVGGQIIGAMYMVEVVENLRLLAGVMFWLFADLFLGMCWIALVMGVLLMIIRGARDDD